MMRIISILLCILCTSDSLFAGGQKIWGVPEEQFLHSVTGQYHPIFTARDAEKYPLRDLDGMSPGAGYFLSFFTYADEKLPYRLLEYEAERGQYLFALLSARRLMELLIRDDLDKEAEMIGTRLSRLFPGDYLLAKKLVESRYWQELDISPDLHQLQKRFDSKALEDPEYGLFAAVNAVRHHHPEWKAFVERLVMEYPASSVHHRFKSYISLHGLPDIVDSHVLTSLNIRLYVQERKFDAAFPLITGLPPRLMTLSMLDDLYMCASSGLYVSGGIEYLDSVIAAGTVVPSVKFRARMYRGLLFRKKGLLVQALEDFTVCTAEAKDPDIRQRMAWYVLESLVRTHHRTALSEFAPFRDFVHDPEYFSDVLSDWGHSLFMEGEYAALEELLLGVQDFAAPPVLSYLSYIVFRLDQTGIYRTRVDAELLRFHITSGEGDGYYRALFGYMNGIQADTVSPAPASGGREGISEGHAAAVSGFFDFGFSSLAYESLLPFKDELATDSVLAFSRLLHEAGRPWEGIRAALWRIDQAPDNLLYPLGYTDIVEKTALEHGLPSWLLYALIRTESFFNPAAVSHAGAVGLTQLMPATAKDVSGRLKLPGIDLTDPSGNIALGGWYLDHLIQRSEAPIYALMGYNAGFSRVRQWRDSWKDIPADLQVELIPYEETRNYVKKITRSALAYGRTYTTADAGDVFDYMFNTRRTEMNK
ncbi:MAG: lytic transglycosylase domain-containing protein [Spirochaetales bacterium]|nr:lytic transglycosylase domain-containing protein [Spirochaetales bacterium]